MLTNACNLISGRRRVGLLNLNIFSAAVVSYMPKRLHNRAVGVASKFCHSTTCQDTATMLSECRHRAPSQQAWQMDESCMYESFTGATTATLLNRS